MSQYFSFQWHITDECDQRCKHCYIFSGNGCNCGNCHITVSSNGDVMACRRVMDSKVANIFEDRLSDVWICQMEKYREYDKFVKCSKCELKAWCRGCPAVANGANGSFYAADPQCWKTKNEITGEKLTC